MKLSRSYVQMLENRVQNMEKLFTQVSTHSSYLSASYRTFAMLPPLGTV